MILKFEQFGTREEDRLTQFETMVNNNSNIVCHEVM
jgi:hypothetical protein